jgi:sporulation protein YqfD
VEVSLTCADPAAAISQINKAGIIVYNSYRNDDDIVIHFQIRRQDYKRLKMMAQTKGYELRMSKRQGVYWTWKQLLHRPVLSIGILLFLAVAMYLPTKVFFFEVEGNVTIPARLILEKCEQCGISFGVSRREVRSEKMKNALLDAIPQLQWAGINTSGCTAVISVRERSDIQKVESDQSVRSIVALRDGIVTQCTATKGNLLCKPGQAVKAGEILISGYTDCGISIRATRAEGEIFAETERNLTVLSPLDWHQKEENQVVEKKYAVIIGKKRINFYKGSGILPTSCDKMYEERYVTLPGGFRLPIVIVTEIWTYRKETDVTLDAPQLQSFARDYLSAQMISGTVLSFDESVQVQSGVCLLQGKYACIEMIGRARNEEIIKPYE